MNQNLLIVDDESEILSWLEELFRHEFDREIGVYTASSAMEALKLLAKVRFDVVLTDIRMPGMDGITLFHHIKENWPRCKTVFLTGYRDFEDIYQVANHQEVMYVLKSEDDDVIQEAVRKFLDQSLQELDAERSRTEQAGWMEKARYWLKKELLDQICAGNTPPDVKERLELLGIKLDWQREALPFLMRIERTWTEAQLQERLRQEDSLIDILRENMPKKLNFYIHSMENNLALFLVQPVEKKETDWELVSVIAQGAVEYTQEKFRNLYGDTLSVVAASEAVMLPALSGYVKEMKKYLVGYIGGAREVILKADRLEERSQGRRLPDSANWTASLKNLMEMGKSREYFELLGSYVRKMQECDSRHDTVALEIYYSISVFLLQFINENYLNEKLAFRLGTYKLTMADAHDSWMEAAEYLTEVSEAVFALLKANENTLADRALDRVVSYIDGNLEEELTLTVLAEVGGFNASYLSRLFKQIKKETISEYILHRRMELAKELLAGTGERIQEIAAKTGYLSPHSFTRAFRGEVGISPTEYREMKRM